MAFLLIVLLAIVCPAFADTPAADPKAVVLAGNARFTVLTPQLVRMEWSPDRKFEDRASLVFINRLLPVPEYKTSRSGGWLVIDTGKLTLRYRLSNAEFDEKNLKVEFKLNGDTKNWTPGMKDEGNLFGTARTLDGAKGKVPLEPGLLSRDGWVLVDDSERPLFDNSDWPWVMSRPPGKRQDWYFFGYGHDYKQALHDYTLVAGKIPLPPRFAFGTWWSRYWSYTDQEFKQLVNEFNEHDVPLDVLVIDMDWHQTFDLRWDRTPNDESGHRKGWSGYTWDKVLFPDPTGFLAWVHEHGLKTTLNLHPASGVQPWEQQYPEMAEAMGIDPATKKYVPFDITNKKFAENYFKILHWPLEKQGVDFWWLDWQQEPNTKIAGVNPTWWLNYVHFTDKERRGQRGLLFHRWGGLGNHRYQIGFSGDTTSNWETLSFETYFTATAANVGYGYWSHDIGGHMPGPVDPEMYTRWVQFGLFSPILRTHTTKNPDAERRIWAYPPEYAETMRDAFLLRYALIPYLYTAGREAYDTGISLCRPLYYDWPEADEAYDYKDEYEYGDAMLAAPVASARSDETLLAKQKVWLPPGTWIEWSSGAVLRGPAKLERTFALDEIPVYVREGAIVPMAPKMRHTGEKPVDPLILAIFPGAKGSTRVYNDAGNALGYKTNEFTWTTVTQQDMDPATKRIVIEPITGSYPGMPQRRAYDIRLMFDWPAESVTINGAAVPASSIGYDGNRIIADIRTPEFSVHDKLEVVVKRSTANRELLHAAAGKIARLRESMQIANRSWPQDWSPESLVKAAQTGDRITLHPETAERELQALQESIGQVVSDLSALHAKRELIERALHHLDGMYTIEEHTEVTAK